MTPPPLVRSCTHFGRPPSPLTCVRTKWMPPQWNIPADRAQRVDDKMRSFVVSLLFPELCSQKCQKGLIFGVFCWWQQKISHSMGKIFRWIWKILSSSFRKCYGLLDSVLPLARFQSTHKNTGFRCILLNQLGLYIDHDHAFFWRNSKRSFRCT